MKNCRKSVRTHQFRHFLSFPLKTIGPRLRRNGTKWTSTVSIETSLLEKKILCNFFVSAWKVLPTVVVHCRHCRYCCRHCCRLCRRRHRCRCRRRCRRLCRRRCRWRSSPLCLARTAHFLCFGPQGLSEFDDLLPSAIKLDAQNLQQSSISAGRIFFCHSSGWSTFVELFFFQRFKS